ncbi:fibronectin type III domain-containing protein [Spirillospora sp. NPDC047279]|uniref:fibronectin type III domain-containing protein n=1 Tax=Spirillospora sp. NPDC047279 TaxID=3155478 RepID=UPI0033C4D63F
MKRKRSFRRVRTTAVLAAASMAVSGLVGVVGTGTASAEPVSLSLGYRCNYPLIGTKDITADITSDIPKSVQVGEAVPRFVVNATTTIGADTTEGLYTMNAATIEGSAVAQARVYTPDFPNGVGANTTVALEKTNVPESGPFSVKATGQTPSLTFDTAGWGQINVGNITLTVTPKDAAGNPTALGTLNVTCYQKPNQDNVLAQVEITESGAPSGGPAPAKVNRPTPQGTEPGTKTYEPRLNEITLNYTCPYPLIGRHPLSVKASIDYPAQIPLNTYAPRIAIQSVSTTDPETTEGLLTLDPPVKTVEGTALAWSTLRAPEVPGTAGLLARVKLPINKTEIPPGPPYQPLVIPAAGGAPQLVFAQAGDASLSVEKIDLTLTPRLADGSPHPDLGTFTRTCTLVAGQDNIISRFTIGDSTPQPPAAVTGLAVDGAATDTTVPLKWNASQGATSYTVYNGDTKVAENVTGTSYTVTGLEAGKQYTLKVVAVNAAGASPPAEVQATTILQKPAAVTGLQATAKTHNTVTLAWSEAARATSYTVKYGDQTKEVTGTTAVIDGLTPNTDYTFSVAGVNGAGPGDAATVAQKTDPEPVQVPAAVTGLEATGKTHNTVSLKWNAATGAESYTVSYAGNTEEVTGGATTVTIAGLTPDTDYSFSVAGKNSAGTGGAATVSQKTDTEPVVKPVPVTGLESTGKSHNTVSLKWNAAAGADKYVVTYGDQSKEVVGGATETTVEGLTPETDYTFSVAGVNSAGAGDAAQVNVKTDPAPDEKPADLTGLTVTGKTHNTVTLGWNAAARATSYKVTYGDQTKDVAGGATTVTIDGLTPATDYTFSVAGVNTAGTGGAATATAKTDQEPDQKPGAVNGLEVTGSTFDSVSLKWNPADRADKYKVDWGSGAEEVTATSYTVKGLSPLTDYKVTVTGVNDHGTGTPAEVSVKTPAKPDVTAPSVPADVKAAVAGSTVNLTWAAAKDEDGGSGLAGYVLYQNGQKVPGVITEPKKAVTGLAAGTYTFEVAAADKAGNESGRSTPPTTAKIDPPAGGNTYGLAGTSAIKGANGKVGLSGSVTAVIDGGKVSADLTLNPATGTFSIFGFIPATANITFVPQGKTTGTVSGSALSTETKTIVKVPVVKVFGMEVGGGANCQTGSAATIPLKSTDWNVGTGGTLKGTYTLPALTGCGPLTQIISALVAGPGNTVDLKATKK